MRSSSYRTSAGLSFIESFTSYTAAACRLKGTELADHSDRDNTPLRSTGRQQLEARGGSLRDVIASGLLVLFCGINPSLYSAAVGHHFARPGNRFWRTLSEAGLTERLLSPFEDALLLERRLGCTNLVARATARADELTESELRAGGARLRDLVLEYSPAWLAILGVSAYRIAFGAAKD